MRPQHSRQIRTFSRRQVLTSAAFGTMTAILAACGSENTVPATTVSIAAPTLVPATTANAPLPATTTGSATRAASVAPAMMVNTASKGEMKYALGIHFPPSLDPTKDNFTLIFNGTTETLTRLTPQNKVEPWLAESIAPVNAGTWRVTLRKNAKFWDGSPVDADAVIVAFKKNWEASPAASGLLAKETLVVAKDAQTLEFTPPKPVGDFGNTLASQYFSIFKPVTNGYVMTGPYRPTKFTVDQELMMEAFADHWGGPPPIARISIRSMTDANARVLALQSGDVDFLWGLPPESIKNFGPEFETTATASLREHYIMLNLKRTPFDDPAVRTATTIAIDRAALVKVSLDGKGTPAIGMFSPDAGGEVVAYPPTDTNRAKQLLDDAGWKPGADGVRAKDGKRLAMTLYSYPGRAELTPIAVQIQAQLKPLGYDMKIQEVVNITNQIKDGNFEASMFSVNTLPTGDPLLYFYSNIVTGAPGNYGGYSNPQVDALIDQLRAETDPAKRRVLSRQAQEFVKADVPNLYLANAPIITATKKGRVKGFVSHPNDIYFLNSSLSVS